MLRYVGEQLKQLRSHLAREGRNGHGGGFSTTQVGLRFLTLSKRRRHLAVSVRRDTLRAPEPRAGTPQADRGDRETWTESYTLYQLSPRLDKLEEVTGASLKALPLHPLLASCRQPKKGSR